MNHTRRRPEHWRGIPAMSRAVRCGDCRRSVPPYKETTRGPQAFAQMAREVWRCAACHEDSEAVDTASDVLVAAGFHPLTDLARCPEAAALFADAHQEAA